MIKKKKKIPETKRRGKLSRPDTACPRTPQRASLVVSFASGHLFRTVRSGPVPAGCPACVCCSHSCSPWQPASRRPRGDALFPWHWINPCGPGGGGGLGSVSAASGQRQTGRGGVWHREGGATRCVLIPPPAGPVNRIRSNVANTESKRF